MIIKVIHIVIIIKIDDHIIIVGSNESSKKNIQNSNFQRNSSQYAPNAHNSQKSSLQHPSNSYNYQTNNYVRGTGNHKYNDNSVSPQSNFSNKTNKYETDSLLLNDVYGKNSSNNFDNSVNNFSNNDSNDFSSIFNNFFQNINNSSNSSDNNNNANNSYNFNDSAMPDIETLMKFKKIFERLNSKSGNDPIVNLLYAVKPFIQDSKKSIVDQIAKFMTIGSALQDFSSFL